MLRNLIALHIELALVAVAIGALLAALDLGVWQLVDLLWDPGSAQPALAQSAIRRLPLWLPSAALLLLPLFALGGVLACAYWTMPTRLDATGIAMLVLPGLASVGVAAWLWFGQGFFLDGAGVSRSLWRAALMLSLMWAAGIAWGGIECLRGNRREGEVRARLTRWLGVVLMVAVAVAGFGALDRVAWWMAFEAEATAEFGAFLLIFAAVLRALLPALGASSGAAPQWLSRRLLSLAHLAGLLLAFTLAAWWVSLLYGQVFGKVFVPGRPEMQFAAGHLQWFIYFAGAAAFLLFTGHDVGFVNLSSLHRFYRARLIRGWLGAANSERFAAAAFMPREPQPEDSAREVTAVTEVHLGDDETLDQYTPQADGGPVHLINVCLNQTQGGKGPFHRDRKGLPLTVMSGGWLRVGDQPWRKLPESKAMTLGSWIAISAAAFAPGLGMMTRSGIAALSMFAGVRLGFWWDVRPLKNLDHAPAWFAKSKLLLHELLGLFRVEQSSFWYLSDGGHIENTAAFALLRERARLIVLADCGADPQYRFADLENLVRKARIDLGARIHFLKPDAALPDPAWRAFGSVADLASPASNACIALGEVTYRDESKGWLVLVKPNLFAGLPVDLVNFKAEYPEFPQQSTADQSFDEAQWESYFMLGRTIGMCLPADLLQRISDGEAERCFKPDDGHMLGAAAAAAPAASAAAGLRARLTSGAVGTSIGLTTAATLAISVWQGIDAWRITSTKATEADDKALKELSDLWGRLRPAASAKAADAATAQALAASLLRIGDTLCPSGFVRWFEPYAVTVRTESGARVVEERFHTAKSILNDARYACQDLAPAEAAGSAGAPASACARLLAVKDKSHCLYEDDARADPESPGFVHCPPRYWGRDYRQAHANKLGNCMIREPVRAGAPPPVVASDGLASCKNRTVFVQVYGSGRERDDKAVHSALQAAGARAPVSEDMLARARLNNRVPPTPVRTDLLRWHDSTDEACARDLLNWLDRNSNLPSQALAVPRRSEPLAAHLKASPGTVELWLAPLQVPR